jgi:hypothetical protein
MNDDLNGVKIGSGLEAGNEADVGGTAGGKKATCLVCKSSLCEYE